MTDWDSIASAIGAATLQPFRLCRNTAITGGWINQTYRIEGEDGRTFFVKQNSASKIEMFSAEVVGLVDISAAQAVRVPKVIAYGISGKLSYLVLEHLNLTSSGDSALLGAKLAMLHRCSNEKFGYSQSNFIGLTTQLNEWSDDWISFMRKQRLGFQLRLASTKGYGDQLDELGDKLLDALPTFFKGYSPKPSLLHGDLWGGNHAYLSDGTPVIFDPAAYYGDREADLAMTELFGGYSPVFYSAYQSAYPLHEGYSLRRDLYNLYHILNHANMFGGGYVQQAEGMMKRLLAKIR